MKKTIVAAILLGFVGMSVQAKAYTCGELKGFAQHATTAYFINENSSEKSYLDRLHYVTKRDGYSGFDGTLFIGAGKFLFPALKKGDERRAIDKFMMMCTSVGNKKFEAHLINLGNEFIYPTK